ncbi:hypothetical protein XENOCAPTIV_020346 [Xenoophorus captivus]|uniref:Uncharacterized protein n=1 Tax=Xenoophorus captivus TaxID=1517983 RepID=A0ABV0S4K5_9TELE
MKNFDQQMYCNCRSICQHSHLYCLEIHLKGWQRGKCAFFKKKGLIHVNRTKTQRDTASSSYHGSAGSDVCSQSAETLCNCHRVQDEAGMSHPGPNVNHPRRLV